MSSLDKIRTHLELIGAFDKCFINELDRLMLLRSLQNDTTAKNMVQSMNALQLEDLINNSSYEV